MKKNLEEEWNEEWKETKGSGFFWKLMLMMALAVFLFSAYQLYSIYREYQDGLNQYKELAGQVVQDAGDLQPAVDEKQVINEKGEAETLYAELPEYDVPEIDFEELYDINHDVVGWIEIEAIPSISYPIMKSNDNAYYLNRTIYKKKNSAGSIFLDYTNSGTFMDCNTVIYGHNMKNGSMFGNLSNLYEQEKYKISRYIWVCTPTAKYRYEIFSMQYAHVQSSVYTFFQTPGEEFLQYLIEMASDSVIDFQTPYLSEDDRIITLSTCTSDENTRFVVQARWIATY